MNPEKQPETPPDRPHYSQYIVAYFLVDAQGPKFEHSFLLIHNDLKMAKEDHEKYLSSLMNLISFPPETRNNGKTEPKREKPQSDKIILATISRQIIDTNQSIISHIKGLIQSTKKLKYITENIENWKLETVQSQCTSFMAHYNITNKKALVDLLTNELADIKNTTIPQIQRLASQLLFTLNNAQEVLKTNPAEEAELSLSDPKVFFREGGFSSQPPTKRQSKSKAEQAQKSLRILLNKINEFNAQT